MLFKQVLKRIKPIYVNAESLASLQALSKQTLNHKNIAYVVPVGEKPEGNAREENVGMALQKVVITFGVITGIRSINDLSGERGLELLEQKRDELRELLHGHHFGDNEQTLLGPSNLVTYVDNGLYWIDRFTTVVYRN
jgi:hypothetical protein